MRNVEFRIARMGRSQTHPYETVWTPGESPGPGGYIVRINNIENGNSVQQTTKIIYLK